MTDVHHLTVQDLPGLVVNRIFHALGPRDLAAASSVCSLWRQHGLDSLSDRLWQGHYTERWRGVPLASRAQRWQVHYGAKLRQLGSYRGRFQQDRLSGHAGGVRCLALQPAHNQLATGSADRTVRLWDLQAGVPRATSRRLGGTVRGLALDEDMLVAGTSQDHAVRVWRSEPGRASFDLRTPKKLTQHTGPVSSVALCASNIFSGSWDYSVRIWDRDMLACRALLSFPDWVDCLAPRGSNLLVAAGGQVYVHSLATAQRTRVITCPPGSVDASARLCVEGRRDSRLLFAGTAAGQVLAFDLRAPGSRPAAIVLGGGAEPVAGLAMEDPWLAAAHGAVTLVDVDAAMRGGRSGRAPRHKSRRQPGGPQAAELAPAARQLPAAETQLQCVDLADQFAAAGGRSGAVQVFDFSGAAAAQARSQAARQGRRAARQARAEHNARLAAQVSLRAHSGGASGMQHVPVAADEPPASVCAAAANTVAPQPVQAASHMASAEEASAGCEPPGTASAPCDQEPAVSEQSGAQHESSGQSEQGQRHVQRWRIIRPQRCKYRHMTADPYEEVEVGA